MSDGIPDIMPAVYQAAESAKTTLNIPPAIMGGVAESAGSVGKAAEGAVKAGAEAGKAAIDGATAITKAAVAGLGQ